MSARLLHAPLLLLLWQVAPVNLSSDRPGPVRIGFGLGGGTLTRSIIRQQGVDCNGRPTVYDKVTDDAFLTAGASAEVRLRPGLHLHAAGGSLKDGSGRVNGAFGAVQAVLERKGVAVGAGLATVGGASRSVSPSASLHVGPLGTVHLRADYRFPEATLGATGWPRIGLELGGHETDKLRIFGGVSYPAAYRERRHAGVFFEAAFSLGGQFRHEGGVFLQGFSALDSSNGTLGTAGVGLWFLP
jgi:hypothetical protein